MQTGVQQRPTDLRTVSVLHVNGPDLYTAAGRPLRRLSQQGHLNKRKGEAGGRTTDPVVNGHG